MIAAINHVVEVWPGDQNKNKLLRLHYHHFPRRNCVVRNLKFNLITNYQSPALAPLDTSESTCWSLVNNMHSRTHCNYFLTAGNFPPAWSWLWSWNCPQSQAGEMLIDVIFMLVAVDRLKWLKWTLINNFVIEWNIIFNQIFYFSVFLLSDSSSVCQLWALMTTCAPATEERKASHVPKKSPTTNRKSANRSQISRELLFLSIRDCFPGL